MKRDGGQLTIGVKYCGGCNPTYDRVALVKGIEKRLRGKASLGRADSEGVSLVLAVEGCATACADLSPFEGLEVWVITCPEDAEQLIRHIEAMVT
jgi:hypothetical protein